MPVFLSWATRRRGDDVETRLFLDLVFPVGVSRYVLFTAQVMDEEARAACEAVLRIGCRFAATAVGARGCVLAAPAVAAGAAATVPPPPLAVSLTAPWWAGLRAVLSLEGGFFSRHATAATHLAIVRARVAQIHDLALETFARAHLTGAEVEMLVLLFSCASAHYSGGSPGETMDASMARARRACSEIFARMMSATEAELKEFSPEQVGVCGRLPSALVAFANCEDAVIHHRLAFCLKCLDCPLLDKRLHGARELSDLCHRACEPLPAVGGAPWLTAELMCNWIVDKGVVAVLLGPRSHAQVLSRTYRLFEFLSLFPGGCPDGPVVNVLWKAAVGKHEAVRAVPWRWHGVVCIPCLP